MDYGKLVIPSGTTVQVAVEGPRSLLSIGMDGIGYRVFVSSSGGSHTTLDVRFHTPDLTGIARKHQGLEPPTDAERLDAALIAGLRAVDADPTLFEVEEPEPISVGSDEFDDLLTTPMIGNRPLRQYIARTLYIEWNENGFDEPIRFRPLDTALTGGDPNDFRKNLQVLAGDGLVTLTARSGAGFDGFEAIATSDLIRQVERYGAAQADVERSADYLDRIKLIPTLSDEFDLIALQRSRFDSATSPEEIVSVFRALAPEVEAVVQRLLTADGSEKQHTSLGPMIHDLTHRSVGDLALRSLVSALKTNARDIAQHGGKLPEGVVRIATENCFELLPLLGQEIAARGQ